MLGGGIGAMGAGGAGVPAILNGIVTTLDGNRSGIRISAWVTRNVPPIARSALGRPVRVISASISAVTRSLESGRALVARMRRSIGVPSVRPMVPRTSTVPGPARPVRGAMRKVLPSAWIVASMLEIRAPRAESWISPPVTRADPPSFGSANEPLTVVSRSIMPLTRRPWAASSGFSMVRSMEPPARKSSPVVAASGTVPAMVSFEAPARLSTSIRAVCPCNVA